MGLFDGALGALLAGASGAGAASAVGALGSLLGGATGGAAPAAGGAAPVARADPMLAAALSLLQQQGGLGGLLGTLQQSGLGAQAASWVGTGANQPVTGPQLGAALGPSTIASFASRLGVPEAQASASLASVLPQLVSHMTPSGQVPDNHGDLLSTAMSMLTAAGHR